MKAKESPAIVRKGPNGRGYSIQHVGDRRTQAGALLAIFEVKGYDTRDLVEYWVDGRKLGYGRDGVAIWGKVLALADV